MNLNRYKIIFLLVAFASTLQAQRFVEETFAVDITPGVVYANNVSILTGAPDTIPLPMDVYTPANDDETGRPLVIFFHTGSFLPAIFNGQITGTRQDSAVVDMARRLVRRGYVAASADYRLGWNPQATDQNVRTNTLLNAAFRGIQDARACVRFFRNSVENEGNPWGVDPDRIVLFGFGTGGFLSAGAGYLDKEEELLLPEFIDPTTALPFINFALSGDINGENNTPLNIANNPGFSNDIAMIVNIGGALGDRSWVSGEPNEPVSVGFHSLQNPFAPFAEGPVLVPVTNDFVINVAGTRTSVGLANGEGGLPNTNAVIDAAGDLSFANSAIEDRNDELQGAIINFGGQDIALSTDHFYPFLSDGPLTGPFDFVDPATLAGTVAFLNANIPGASFNADTLIANAIQTNPNFSRESGLAYLDTIADFFIPRAFLALDLENVGVNVNDTPLIDAGMTLVPNPATSSVRITTDNEYEIIDLGVYDMAGKLVQSHIGINTTDHVIQKNSLAPGMYMVKARFAEGIQASKILFQ